MKTKILIIITVLLFSIMLVLTFSARSIHETGLPHVKTGRLTEASFPFEFTDENGAVYTGYRHAPAISKEQLEQGVYVLYTAEKNGEKRNFVRRAEIVFGAEHDGYFEVLGGVSSFEKIVVEWDGEIGEGEVVYLKQ